MRGVSAGDRNAFRIVIPTIETIGHRRVCSDASCLFSSGTQPVDSSTAGFQKKGDEEKLKPTIHIMATGRILMSMQTEIES